MHDQEAKRIAVLSYWLPCVFLGVSGEAQRADARVGGDLALLFSGHAIHSESMKNCETRDICLLTRSRAIVRNYVLFLLRYSKCVVNKSTVYNSER